MSTKFLSPNWRMPRNANQSKSTNYSLDFDGSNVIEVPLTIDGLSSVTMSVWFKNNFDTQTNKYLLSFPRTATNNGFDINFNLQEVRSSLSGSSGNFNVLSSTFTYTDGNWHHVAVSYDGTSHKMYIDGVLTALDSVSYGTINNTTGMFYIGAFNVSGSSPVSGIDSTELNQVAVFDYALSDGGVSVGGTATGQIAQLYGNGYSLSNPMALPSPPIAYYPLGESAGGFVGGTGTWLTENNAIGDYVFDFPSSSTYFKTKSGVPALSGASKFSVSVWASFKDMNTYHRVMGVYQWTNFWFSFNYNAPTDTLSALAFDTGKEANVVTNNQIKLNEWCLLTIVYDGTFTDSSTSVQNAGRLKIYINKTAQTLSFIGVIPSTSPSTLINYPFNLASDGYRTRPGNRKLSNAKIWSEPLTSSDVETLYNYGSPIRTLANIPQSSNLKAWYKLDATGIYNSTNTDWEVSDATAAIKNTILDPQNSISRPYYEEITGANLLPLTGTAGQSITISFWYYASGNADNIMFSRVQGGAYWFGKESTNNLRFLFTNNSGWTLGPSVPRDQWNHIVLTVTESGTSAGRTVKFYVNGGSPTTVTDSSSNLTNFPVPSSAKNTFGVGSTGSTNVDVLSSNYIYYNTALLDSEVTNLYNSFSPDSENTPTVQPALSNFPKNSNITGWFKSDGLDSSGEGNNASSVGNILIGPAVSLRNGATIGMSQSNLVQSDLQTVAPYSKYALNFNGTGDYIDLNSDITLTGNKSVSFWVNFTSTIYGVVFGGASAHYYPYIDATNIWIRAGGDYTTFAHGGLTSGVWYNICITGDGTNATAYLNGSSLGTQTDRGFTIKLINGEHTGIYGVDGKLSNCAIWNTVLTSSQVREIYNEGLPSNLHNFSGTAPVAWWQLGENSSFTGDWICADEIGSNNGDSDGMGVDALTNGVGTTANGTSTGMSEGSLVGDAPYSTGNAISSGMPVTARGTDVPS